LLAILLHGRNVLVRYNTPRFRCAISCREDWDEEQALRKLSRVLRVHFRRQRQMAIGPDLSHRNTQVDAVLAGEQVRAAIISEAATHGIPLGEARARAVHFALEIASDYSYGVRARPGTVPFLVVDAPLRRHRNCINFDVVTRIASGHEIVYVPCHRSHIDYLLLSYIIVRQGLTPPHIAAGANLNLPLVVGSLLRRGGAFFLRRSFKGEPLYAAVFHEYLHLMLARGFPIEYFIEGGRSRSGRMLTPKAGILGMTVQSFIREHARPLVFVPVYIGYEKLMEGSTYLGELAGKPKQGESLWGILKSVRSIKRVFGQVHVNVRRTAAAGRFSRCPSPGLERGRLHQRIVMVAHRHAQRGSRTRQTDQRGGSAQSGQPDCSRAAGDAQAYRRRARALQRMIEHYQALARDAPYAPTTIACGLDGARSWPTPSD
jgi:glycerol-3-phosphate O-acyltransferase